MSNTTHPQLPDTTVQPPNASTASAAPAPTNSQSTLGEFPEEILNEWRWIFAARERGDFDSYRGQHVAVLNGQILGSGYDPQLLVELLASKHNLDPKRIVTVYVGNW